MKNIGQMLKAAQEMKTRMEDAQKQLEALEVRGVSGAGMVEVAVSGKFELKSVRLDPSILRPEDAEMVQDLIVAAFADAKVRVDEVAKEKMAEVTGGLSLPGGMGLPF
ncbi:YbaB/EbfC family nucleoid-associated protein [Phaeovibrio sulfidiphilus]|uniref:Nucleoid-associated protein IHV25_07830 n=1 Tax=Phaeovibrio sulfidiphilus TaxID=1220600 RepID=A0A8J6YPZ8_9PROT|nr:YbaB/EbfC family nucleoid-associated protein [Phaeovibrio sulfidiphilus]MBE1237556.1 YbaB/EbfC family nucleoid-associated protein [Phaeovibrio sulfidiphilus]